MRGLRILGELVLMGVIPILLVTLISLTSGFASFALMLLAVIGAGMWTMHTVDRYLDGR